MEMTSLIMAAEGVLTICPAYVVQPAKLLETPPVHSFVMGFRFDTTRTSCVEVDFIRIRE